MKKFVTILLTLCLACLCLFGCNSEEEQKKYILYCGLNDATTKEQLLTVDQAQPLARAVITDRGLGLTEYVAYGAYKEDNTIKGNDTLVYILMFVSEAEAIDIGKAIKETLHLDSILIETVSDSYSFID